MFRLFLTPNMCSRYGNRFYPYSVRFILVYDFFNFFASLICKIFIQNRGINYSLRIQNIIPSIAVFYYYHPNIFRARVYTDYYVFFFHIVYYNVEKDGYYKHVKQKLPKSLLNALSKPQNTA